MRLCHFSRDGLMWQCPSRTCGCNRGSTRQRISIRRDSFLSYIKTPVDKVLLVVYYYLAKTPVGSISSTVGHHQDTVRHIVQCVTLLMQAHLTQDDQRIGMLNIFYCILLFVNHFFL
jgi:hypothetical protein